MKPRIAVTLGDPLGVGPALVKKCLENSSLSQSADWTLFSGEPNKKPNPKQAGQMSWTALEQALTSLQTGFCQALVTGPVSKTHLHLAGFKYLDQTSFLTQKTNSQLTAMMMASPELRVVLTTIHIPLRQVPQKLTTQLVLDKILLTHRSLQTDFAMTSPRLAVCGLNPHAGEKGLMGFEDEEIIRPAIVKARRKKINVTGPLPADTVFWQARQGLYDVIIAHYHDQGLIPVKTLAFDQTVNVTLGLPFIRTSPDHGPAFDLKNKSSADPTSMMAAMQLAITLTKNRVHKRNGKSF